MVIIGVLFISVGVQSPTEINAPLMMHTRAVWKELPDGNPRAARKSRERDLKNKDQYPDRSERK